MRPTLNQDFDAYKHKSLTRLANEQERFLPFLELLRQAKDRAEIDDFLKNARAMPKLTKTRAIIQLWPQPWGHNFRGACHIRACA